MNALTKPPAPINSAVRIRPGRRNSLRQALQIQQRVFDEGMKSGVTPGALAQLARAWDILEERKRILRGRPLPGSLKPEKPKSKQKINLWETSFRELPEPAPGLDACEPVPVESLPKPDEVKYEMREGPPGVFMQVVIKSPALSANSPAG